MKKIISELGLRFRPSAQADLEAHSAKLAFLAMDCADVPARFLEAAAKEWTRTSRFLPTASELIALAQGAQMHVENRAGVRVKGSDRILSFQRKKDGSLDLDALVDSMNAGNTCKHSHWTHDGNWPPRMIENAA